MKRSTEETERSSIKPSLAGEVDSFSMGRGTRRSFSWLCQWRTCPTFVIAGVYELYEQLLPTRVYHRKKTRTGPDQIMCRLCGKETETVAYILAGCSALAHSKYLQRHNAVLKIIFFEMLHSLDLVDSVPPWYSPSEPGPVYQNNQAQAFWDVHVYADYVHAAVRANRVDARIVDSTAKSAQLCKNNCQTKIILSVATL